MAVAKLSVKDQYKNICEQHPELPVFMQYWWLDEVCNTWDVALVYNGEHLAGAWPYQMEKKAGVSVIRTPQLTPYLGPFVFYPSDLKLSKRDNFEHETIEALLQKMPAAKVWSVALPPGLKQVGLFKDSGFEQQTKQTFIVDLGADEGTIFSNLNEDHRRNIRKAEKELTIIDEPQLLKQLYDFQKTTLQAKNLDVYYSFRQMQSVFKACRQRNQAALWVAKKDGEVQAIIWHLWDDERAYYLTGSKNPTANNKKALTALLWHAIRESLKMRKKIFDFEGSMDPGVEQFFRNFGGSRELYLVLKKNDSLIWKLKEKIRG
jgi:lipid II:glycine glycyltransferase (peptidoglycan interpeptide bridge formation enzyme)